MKNMNYVVVGRLLFDDEDTCAIYHDVTEEQALDRFIKDMIAASGKTREQLLKQNGLSEEDEPVLILHVLECEGIVRRKYQVA